MLSGHAQHLQVLDHSQTSAVIGHQPVVGRSISRGWIQLLPVLVVGEGAGLSRKWPNHVAEINQGSAVAPLPGQLKHQIAAQKHLQFRLVTFDPHPLSNEPRGNRVTDILDPDRALRVDHNTQLTVLRQPVGWQGLHHSQFLYQPGLASGIG